MRVAVVGGGITGLAAAYEATKAGHAVTLYEASHRLGGKILTTPFQGVPVDAGPDAFLARVPHAVELCKELGLAEQLVAPAAGRACVWTRGRLRPLPEGVVLGVPTNLVAMARSGILSPAGVVRAGLDLVLPRTRLGDDPSAAEVITARFGAEATDRLVEPLLGGIHAGRTDRLSLSAVAPQLAAAAAKHRSLLLGLRGTPPSLGAVSGDGPVFFTLKDGLGALVGALADRLDDVRLDHPLDALPDADQVIVTTPAPVTAKLVDGLSPAAADELRAIEHSSVALVTMAYPRLEAQGAQGSGFLVPRVDGRLMTACSFATNKWPHWADAEGHTLLRVSAGRAGDDRAMRLGDDDVVGVLHNELREAIGVTGDGPVAARVTRWVDGFPQYAPGHAARVARIEAALDGTRVRVAGAALHGVGIPACIASGRSAARACADARA